MILVDKIKVYGFEETIRGTRNSWNSWDKSDTDFSTNLLVLGKNDEELLMKLCKNGSEHRKFMRMIFVTMDINAPLYWWKEFDQYKIGVTTNSCSTMHTITKNEFKLEDFSFDMVDEDYFYETVHIVNVLNELRMRHLNGDKLAWGTLIQLLPSSYMQLRTVSMSYENVLNIIKQRDHHKLKDWTTLCSMLKKELPYMEEFLNSTKSY